MKKLFLLVPLFALAACDNAVADAVRNIDKYVDGELKDGTPIPATAATIGEFSELAALGPDNVEFRVGSTFSITATGDADVVAKLRYIIKDGTLKVGRGEYDRSIKDDKATIIVTAPSLSKLALAGSGDVKADKLSGTDVKLSLAGSGDLDVAAVEATAVKGNLAGSGNIKMAGRTTNADFSIAGSGSMLAGQLLATDAKVSIAGSGDAEVHASGNVKASIAGSGDINVTGGGKCDSSTIGSGKIVCS